MFKKIFGGVSDGPEQPTNADRFHTVTATYEGEVDSADYWDPECPESFDGVVMLPHGFGKLTFMVGGEIVERYEGEFSNGVYHGDGVLRRRGEQYAGAFEDGKYLAGSED